jgi:hypothetical protein
LAIGPIVFYNDDFCTWARFWGYNLLIATKDDNGKDY